VLARPTEPLHETLLLFLARQVEEKLENDRALPREVILEMRDIRKPLPPDVLAHELRRHFLSFEDVLVHAHNEDFFIVRPVENSDSSPLGQRLGVAPEKVVIEVLGRGLLEGEDL